MSTFTLQFEYYEQKTAFVEVEAKDLNAAIERATEVDPNVLDWEATGDGPDDARLYAVLDGEGRPLATVKLPEFSGAFSWTRVDLREQWSRTLQEGSLPELLHLQEMLATYFAQLAPDLTDVAKSDLRGESIDVATGPASGEARPIRI